MSALQTLAFVTLMTDAHRRAGSLAIASMDAMARVLMATESELVAIAERV